MTIEHDSSQSLTSATAHRRVGLRTAVRAGDIPGMGPYYGQQTCTGTFISSNSASGYSLEPSSGSCTYT